MPKAICEDCGSLVEAELTHNGVCQVGHYVHCGWGHQLSPDDLISDAAAIEALNEQLEAARADAKEAEAYAEGLEKERDEWKSLAEAAIKDDASKNIYYAELKAKLATCEKCRDAYDRMGRIGTQAVRDLEAKLEKAVEAIRNVVEEYDLFRKNEYERGLSPLDDEIHAARATLAEIEGEKG
jgi:hypothetical protein